MTLTDEQVNMWRKVLVNMGMMEFDVNSLPKEDIENITSNIQRQIYVDCEDMEKKPFKSKFRYKRF